MRKLWWPLMMALLSPFPAFAAHSGILEEWTLIMPSVQYFSWSEYRNDGTKILSEEGPLVAVGGSARLNLYNGMLMLKSKVELFGGDVHYNGRTQPDPDPAISERPVKTDVIYFGTRVENDLGWRFASGVVSAEPFAGLGYRWWIRSLRDSTTTDTYGNSLTVGGATEYWQTLYCRVGARASWKFAEDMEIFAEGGGKYPLYNENRADSAGTGTVTVRPGKEWSAFGEIGSTWKRFRASLYYEGFRFSRSAVVPINSSVGVYQPKSESDIYGINLNWLF